MTEGKYTSISLRLIKYWSSLKHTQSHNTSPPYNNTCSSIIKNLNKLQMGIFLKGKSFDPDWMKQQNLSEDDFNKPYPYDELKNGLKQASKYSLKFNNNPLRSLHTIIYNQITRKSWLISAIKNPLLDEKKICDSLSRLNSRNMYCAYYKQFCKWCEYLR